MKRRGVLALADEPAPLAVSWPCSSWHGGTSNLQNTGTNQEELHPTGSGRTLSWSEVDGVAASARVGLSLSRHGYPSSRVQARASEPFPAGNSPVRCSRGLVPLPASSFQWLLGPLVPRLFHLGRRPLKNRCFRCMGVGLFGHRHRGCFLLQRRGFGRLRLLRQRRARAGSKSSCVCPVPEHPKARYFTHAEESPILSRFFGRKRRLIRGGEERHHAFMVSSPREPPYHRGAGKPVSTMGHSLTNGYFYGPFFFYSVAMCRRAFRIRIRRELPSDSRSLWTYLIDHVEQGGRHLLGVSHGPALPSASDRQAYA